MKTFEINLTTNVTINLDGEGVLVSMHLERRPPDPITAYGAMLATLFFHLAQTQGFTEIELGQVIQFAKDKFKETKVEPKGPSS